MYFTLTLSIYIGASLCALENTGSIPEEIKALGSCSKIFVKMVSEREKNWHCV